MHEDCERILISEEKIAQRVEELARSVSEAYRGEDLLAVCILKGSVPFFADLVRRIEIPVEEDFLEASSYEDRAVSSGVLKIKKDLDCDVKGRNVLLVEDVIDSGYTLFSLKRLLQERGARSVKIAALLEKKISRSCEIRADFVGFEVGGEFLVGYGLDYAQRYRQLPYIAVLKAEKIV